MTKCNRAFFDLREISLNGEDSSITLGEHVVLKGESLYVGGHVLSPANLKSADNISSLEEALKAAVAIENDVLPGERDGEIFYTHRFDSDSPKGSYNFSVAFVGGGNSMSFCVNSQGLREYECIASMKPNDSKDPVPIVPSAVRGTVEMILRKTKGGES